MSVSLYCLLVCCLNRMNCKQFPTHVIKSETFLLKIYTKIPTFVINSKAFIKKKVVMDFGVLLSIKITIFAKNSIYFITNSYQIMESIFYYVSLIIEKRACLLCYQQVFSQGNHKKILPFSTEILQTNKQKQVC